MSVFILHTVWNGAPRRAAAAAEVVEIVSTSGSDYSSSYTH